jgi:UDP-GlcNAc:undecaprenyl-phosphate GlcNAc-1-phosphate transferase
MPMPVLIIATALFASLSLTPVAMKLALHFGVIDHPGVRKVHLSPVPLWGGLAMYGATILALALFSGDLDPAARVQILGIVSGASVLVLVGSLDDRGVLHHQIKLFVAMPIAALILIGTGIHANVFTALFGSALTWVLADVALTLLWVVGITAAFSILDHMDGLCAGVAALASLFFLVSAVLGGQVLVGTLAAAVLGASLGFLRWNFKPARIFMGDGGAMFLGFMMATLGLKLHFAALSTAHAAIIPAFILAVPIFDTTLVTISRARRGLLPFASPGKDHTSHRLATLGIGHTRAVLALYAAGALAGVTALVLERISASGAVWIVAAACTAGAVAIAALERSPFERQEQR